MLLADHNEFHFSFRKLKQGQIFLEHKEEELVLRSLREERAQEGKHVLSDASFATLDYGGGNADAHVTTVAPRAITGKG